MTLNELITALVVYYNSDAKSESVKLRIRSIQHHHQDNCDYEKTFQDIVRNKKSGWFPTLAEFNDYIIINNQLPATRQSLMTPEELAEHRQYYRDNIDAYSARRIKLENNIGVKNES